MATPDDGERVQWGSRWAWQRAYDQRVKLMDDWRMGLSFWLGVVLFLPLMLFFIPWQHLVLVWLCCVALAAMCQWRRLLHRDAAKKIYEQGWW